MANTFTPYANTDFYNPNRGYREWLREEIVSFPGETNKYIPNRDDSVRDWAQGVFRVVAVDESTGMSVLEKWKEPKEPDEDGDENVLIATGPGYSSESYRMFLDQTVVPHTFAPDLRCHFYGTEVDFYRVFRGSDINETTGKVISAFYDASNTYLGPNVPVEIAVLPGMLPGTQYEHGVTAPMVGFTSEAMPDGERVTLVAYSKLGKQLSVAQLTVVNSEAIRQPDTSKRYVKGIKLETNWISASDPMVVEFPLNVTVESLMLQGTVFYQDGKRDTMSVNNGRMELHGLRNYIATEVGQEFKMPLTYQLASDEISYGLTPTTDRKIVANYIARTSPADGAYSCRMFVYPVWVNPAIGYRLEFWLYNQDRQRFWNITPHVQLGALSRPFDPKGYGFIQTLTFAVNLNTVDGVFRPIRFVSEFQIALLTEGGNNANWEVFARPDQGESYGRDLKANLERIEVNRWNLRLANGAQTKEQWLQRMYFAAEPLVNPQTEVIAPTPTHFRCVFMHNTYEYDVVTQWNETLVVNNDLSQDGELMYIQWIKRTPLGDLQLAMTAVPIKQS